MSKRCEVKFVRFPDRNCPPSSPETAIRIFMEFIQLAQVGWIVSSDIDHAGVGVGSLTHRVSAYAELEVTSWCINCRIGYRYRADNVVSWAVSALANSTNNMTDKCAFQNHMLVIGALYACKLRLYRTVLDSATGLATGRGRNSQRELYNR